MCVRIWAPSVNSVGSVELYVCNEWTSPCKSLIFNICSVLIIIRHCYNAGISIDIVLFWYTATEGKYAATESYIAQESDEISLPQGTVVDVMKKSVEGWWTIRYVF